MTAEQQALHKKANDCWQGAELLANAGHYDLAAGRAYYAMFHIASLFLLERGLTFSKHGSVLAAFGLHFIKTSQLPVHFHRYLLDAQDKRLIGDYDTAKHISHSEVVTLIQQAKEFIELAEAQFPSLKPVPLATNPPTVPTN